MRKADALSALLTIPEIRSPIMSKNSKYISFTWINVHPNADVFIVPTDGSAQPKALTETPEATFAASFAPDSRSVIVGEDKDRNERVRLFEVYVDEPKRMIPLTEEDPSFFLRGGALHPNRRWLVYGANYDAERNKEIEPTWVYRQDLQTREIIPLAKPEKPAWLFPQMNGQGTHVLYNRKEAHPKGDQIWLVDIEGKEDREILNFGPKARIRPVWLPEGRKVALITETKNGNPQRHYSLGIYDIAEEETVWLIDDPHRNIEDIHCPISGHHLVVLEYEKARVRSSIVDLVSMEEKSLPTIRTSLIPIGPITEDEWAGLYYSSTQPREIVRFNINNVNIASFKPLTHVRERTSIKHEELVPAEDFEWKSRDGLSVHGWLHRSSTPTKRAIVYVHGGPTAHAEDDINPQVQYLASRGFNVLSPNYRGSTGYGVAFEDLIRVGGWGSDEQEDVWAGAKALIEEKVAEKAKIGITGTSYGGYSSWYGITKAPNLFAAAVPICGMTDLVVDYETTRPDLRPYSEEMLGGSPQEVPERYYERSPINFIHQIKGKILIVQGAKDPNVTPRNVEEVVERLDAANIEYKLMVFENEGHGILRVKNRKKLYRKMAEFFDKRL
jgi:dipeptidyl aminopeptidase/acylaminoacyl peptidase